LGILEPGNLGVNQSIRILAFLVVGGENSVFGPLVGSLILTFFQEILGAFSLMFYGLMIMAAVILFPEGVVSRKAQNKLFGWLGIGGLRARSRP
ncbi:MAG: hypothetical protein WCX93_06290, partial [Burkholderiaceae bacterium]